MNPCPMEEWIHPNDYTIVLKWAYVLSQMSLILQSRKTTPDIYDVLKKEKTLILEVNKYH